VICPAEHPKVEDGWADVVLCLSGLEHVDDPAQVVRELLRVAKTDGVVFASTHGSFPWHPYPQDHWRWTQTGLPLLFIKYGSLSSVDIHATRGTISGIFFVLAHILYSRLGRTPLRRSIRKPVIMAASRLGEYLDKKMPDLKDIATHVTAIPEFFIIARK